jgi:hypothetical protein
MWRSGTCRWAGASGQAGAGRHATRATNMLFGHATRQSTLTGGPRRAVAVRGRCRGAYDGPHDLRAAGTAARPLWRRAPLAGAQLAPVSTVRCCGRALPGLLLVGRSCGGAPDQLCCRQCGSPRSRARPAARAGIDAGAEPHRFLLRGATSGRCVPRSRRAWCRRPLRASAESRGMLVPRTPHAVKLPYKLSVKVVDAPVAVVKASELQRARGCRACSRQMRSR